MRKENFNANWRFYKESSPAEVQEVWLPHDAMILEEKREENPTAGAGGYFPGGVYYYEKSFDVPLEAKEENWILEFEGIYKDAYIYLNQRFIASNHSGYRGFYVDLKDYIRPGETNNIKIKVCNDAIKNSRWYSGSGIYRPVWLWKSGNIHIALDGLRIDTPEVEPEVSQVRVSVSLKHRNLHTTKVRLHTKIYEQSGAIVHTASVPVTLFPGENPVITQRLYMREVKLWSLDHPNLYHCEVTICNEDEQCMDHLEDDFGIRHIQMDPVKGIRINGEPVLLRGSCIHHDNGILGAATYYDAEERRIAISKAAGFNAIRIAHQPASKSMLAACDRLGMLLMEESFDMWNRPKNTHDASENFAQEWERDVEAIVAKDYNHPSVFVYCIGNEIEELIDEDGIHCSRLLSDKFRTLDATRPVTNAVNGQPAIGSNGLSILKDMGILNPEQIKAMTGDENADDTQITMAYMTALATGDINDVMTALTGNLGRVIEHHSVADKLEEIMSHLDLCGYNYMMRRYAIDLELFPDRMIVGSETNPPEIDRLWDYVKRYPGCTGDFTWSGWDYIGEAGVGLTNYEGKQQFGAPYPAYLAYCGDMDLIGHRRPLSYFREIVFGRRTEPYISVQDPKHFHSPAACTPWAVPETIESWTWPDCEGENVRVLVYAAGDEVALLCNGKEIGRKPVGAKKRYQAEFETTYVPGELLVVNYEHGQKIGKCVVRTAESSVKLNITASRDTLEIEKEQISFLSVSLVDDNGILHTDKERLVKIEAEEGLQILGFGSADPYSKENFFDSKRTTYRGKLLAAIRGTRKGIFKVKLSCDDCKEAIMEIIVR